ncbi:M23 family metallopeptidase [Helicobacter sp. MIT 11-5569]|uniref:M23 family metallopeptidase n=1 Tax=Helicobacter sp. MIT 11-5569 TaxID=1548151 RepID=UPI00051FDF2B|nr:M23 family metallopeptidase [Helicobacter sp. MIT 11-5569]TLD83474.1 M23 family metallopeptidase [Helicobacter sp. MIT 11-5569]
MQSIKKYCVIVASVFAFIHLPLKAVEQQTEKNPEFVVENGKTIILSTKLANPKPIVVNKKTYHWVTHPNDTTRKIAILAIPYYTKPSLVRLENGDAVEIVQGNYKKEAIQASPSKVKPNPKNQERIKKERDEANAIYSNYSQTRLWDSAFAYPMQSKITSAYGNARTFNGEVKSYHSGTDFRAAIGTEIFASNRGKVVIAKNRFLAGGSVVLDHGEGVFSMYYHCSEIKVQVGQIVEKGDLIALSGATGRVSGPHLHFGILVRGAQVDPLDFITQVNGLFASN